MLHQCFLALALFAYAAFALQCHIVPSGNLSVPDTSPLQDCGIGSLTCLKIVDYNRGTYIKQCQTLNCTMNYIQNSVANCQNSSNLGASVATCCCYGDGCNSTPKTGVYSAIGITAASLSLMMLTA